jgi:hypothetical protein
LALSGAAVIGSERLFMGTSGKTFVAGGRDDVFHGIGNILIQSGQLVNNFSFPV